MHAFSRDHGEELYAALDEVHAYMIPSLLTAWLLLNGKPMRMCHECQPVTG